MIELTNIKVTFAANTSLAHTVLHDINFKVKDGDFITIIGGNGAGKSTLLNVISGDIKPEKGSVIIDSVDVTHLETEERAKDIARVFQDPMIGTCAALTIEENLSLALRRGQSRGLSMSITRELRDSFHDKLADLHMGLENRLDEKVSQLSGGQRQVLSLLMATLSPCKLLLLDEHTAALDPKMARKVLKLTKKVVEEKKLTALMITHSMAQALEFGNRTIMMYHGEITKDMCGKMRKALDQAKLLEFFDL